MDKSTALRDARRYAALVRGMMDTRQVYLYGSHARGEAAADSDIDIAVVVDAIEGDYLNTVASLWEAGAKISNYIEPVLLVHGNDKSGFLNEIINTGIRL